MHSSVSEPRSAGRDSGGLVALLVVLIAAWGAAVEAASLPAAPAGWPTRLQLGVADSPGGAARLAAVIPGGFRYQYLAGGVNTGTGWATWNPDGTFVTSYVQESVQAGIIPVFSYYMLRQSLPGSGLGESDGVATNLQTVTTMRAYYEDLRLFFQRAGAFAGRPVVLHVEPDLWGFMQQRVPGDDAGAVPVRVASTGLPELAGLPETLAGFARAVAVLRAAYAPNVLLAYHISVWGTGSDISLSNPSDATVDQLASRAGRYFDTLGAAFDLAFAEFSDRDAGYYQFVLGDGGAHWWDAADYGRMARFLAQFVKVTGRRVVMWQIPLGNTRMRAMNNSWGHYQDNRVEWFLDDPGRGHLAQYAEAGVLAFLFGGGAAGTTCACDATGDGVTNPAPINGNTGLSLGPDDDGGFFRQKAQEYYGAGALPLPAPGLARIVTGPGPGELPAVRGFTPGTGPTLELLTYDPSFRGGVFVTLGNVDGAGASEIVTGAGPGGGPHVRVFQSDGSVSGLQLMAYAPGFAGGVRVASCDVDGDGRAEIITAPGPGGGPHVRVWKAEGTSVSEVAGFYAYHPGFLGGVFVACGDVDGDGRAEVITGADAGGGPHVRVWRVTAGIPMEVGGFFAFDPRFTGGVRVAAADVTGEGRAAVITAAGPGAGPHVRVFGLDGAAPRELASFFAYAAGFRGGVFVAAGRVLDDGVAQIVTGAGAGGGPHVRVFTGAGADTGIGFFGYASGFTGGISVAAGP